MVGVITVNLGHKMISAPFHRFTTSSQSRLLTVLVSTGDAGVGEVDYWIHRILTHLERPVDVQVVDGKNLRVVDDSIIIGKWDLTEWKRLIETNGFRNVGLLRIGEYTATIACQFSSLTTHPIGLEGDEFAGDGSYKPFSYVLRPYWFEKYTNQTDHIPVVWIPNGYSQGVGPRFSPTLLPYSMRPQLCYFEGSARDNGQPSSREKMRAALAEWDPKGEICAVQWTSGFRQGHSPLIYSTSFGRAKYALCPGGNNAETIRYAPSWRALDLSFVSSKVNCLGSTRSV